MNIFENISISLVDVHGIVAGGILLLLNLQILDESFELAYWFNDKDEFVINPEDKLLNILEVNNLKEFEYYNDFIIYIDDNIDKNGLFKQFLTKK